MRYEDLARVADEGRRLGIRLFLVPAGAERYWPELLDLALRQPESTFLLFSGHGTDDGTGSGSFDADRAAGEAAAAGNVGFVLPRFGSGAPAAAAAFSRAAAALREAGAPFGFVTDAGAAGSDGKGPEESGEEAFPDEAFLEEALKQGALFGMFHTPAASLQAAGTAYQGIGSLRQASPVWLLDLEEDLLFTNEGLTKGLVPDESGRVGRRGRHRPALLVHPVSPRMRWMTLLESLQAVSLRPPGKRAAGSCPLLLDLGDTRQVFFRLSAGSGK
jgi:hypothetical protein